MIDVEQLIEQACVGTGFDDFGAPSFREGLNRFAASLNEEAELTPMGQAMATGAITTALVNRLHVEHWWTNHPELDFETIDAPVIIVGMSRSGTTALSHLLGADPELRSLRAWEAKESVPPPEASNYWADERYLAAVASEDLAESMMPGLKALHHDPPDAPVECNSLFVHEFNSTVFSTVYFVPDYFRWMMDSDQTGAYAYHERMLKLLQSRTPGRWNLKGPQHGYAMDALRRRYPDATIVVTHRDPSVCTTSTASLLAFFQTRTSGQADPKSIGALTTEFMVRCADGLVADVDRHGMGSMVHVPYEELLTDPIASVRRVYDAMGRELTSDHEDVLRGKVADRPQHKFGRHDYSPDQYGIDVDELAERFSSYRTTFGLA